MKFLCHSLTTLVVFCFLNVNDASAIAVDLELALVIDVSGSVNSAEYNLQMQGYRDAFLSGAVQTSIQALGDAGTGGIAVGVFFFASNATPTPALGWTQLQSAADAATFAGNLFSLPRPSFASLGGNRTNIADGISDAQNSILGNFFEGSRLTIDVSGDGIQNIFGGVANCGGDCIPPLHAARDAAAGANITVNGLAIATPTFPNLLDYFTDNVQTANGFSVQADSFADFSPAVQTKVFREIAQPVPEPGTIALIGIGLVGIGVHRRRKRRRRRQRN